HYTLNTMNICHYCQYRQFYHADFNRISSRTWRQSASANGGMTIIPSFLTRICSSRTLLMSKSSMCASTFLSASVISCQRLFLKIFTLLLVIVENTFVRPSMMRLLLGDFLNWSFLISSAPMVANADCFERSIFCGAGNVGLIP